MGITDIFEWAAKGLEIVGVFVLVAGISWSVIQYLRQREELQGTSVYQHFRQSIGRSILLGLELLVAADIIHTVATPLTFESLGMLGMLILIRTFLSVEIEMELEGRWPWQMHTRREAQAIAGEAGSPER